MTPPVGQQQEIGCIAQYDRDRGREQSCVKELIRKTSGIGKRSTNQGMAAALAELNDVREQLLHEAANYRHVDLGIDNLFALGPTPTGVKTVLTIAASAMWDQRAYRRHWTQQVHKQQDPRVLHLQTFRSHEKPRALLAVLEQLYPIPHRINATCVERALVRGCFTQTKSKLQTHPVQQRPHTSPLLQSLEQSKVGIYLEKIKGTVQLVHRIQLDVHVAPAEDYHGTLGIRVLLALDLVEEHACDNRKSGSVRNACQPDEHNV